MFHKGVCRIMGFVAYGFLALLGLWHYGVCCLMEFVALWGLSHYGVCHTMGFIALWGLSLIGFVALYGLPLYGVCCLMAIMGFVILWGLSPIMGSSDYGVCPSIEITDVSAEFLHTIISPRKKRPLSNIHKLMKKSPEGLES